MQKLAIFGSTGSVGKSTLDVVSRHPAQFQVVALSAGSNVEAMLLQCASVQPQIVVMAEENAALHLQTRLGELGLGTIQVESGENALLELAGSKNIDTVMSAIVGAAGLMPTLRAVQAAKRVLIANKEPLVMTGDLFMREARKSGAVILPIDSEHNAIYQCLPEDLSTRNVRKIHLTASGGPFRGQPWADLADVTPAEACAHPNWSMGQKISVDSATLMNKGLELIEASALFGIPAGEVEIIVHPQSIIHSLVEYTDGSFLAQLGAADMRIPIAHALAWPDRIESGSATLQLTDIAQLDFHQPDLENLPCLRLARQAAVAVGSAPATLNAANEVAVDAFLRSELSFTNIPVIIEKVLESLPNIEFSSVEDVLKIDNEARQLATAAINSLHT
ncbi:MAG: 1-deoxy-D-xylulose-5-phosphate reductoisomerase [Gammaproteobacteria bacterium]|nr:1-deoxy-D-xylulose-5-phosphate reductoisomerase [Gammaproteobacteria bacterium]